MVLTAQIKICRLRYRVNCDFVAIVPELLRLLVIGVLVGDVEGRRYRATIPVLSFGGEEVFCVKLPVLGVDRVVERQEHYLRYLFGVQVTRYAGGVFRAEAVRQAAPFVIARRRPIRIVFLICTNKKLYCGTRKTVTCSWKMPRELLGSGIAQRRVAPCGNLA